MVLSGCVTFIKKSSFNKATNWLSVTAVLFPYLPLVHRLVNVFT